MNKRKTEKQYLDEKLIEYGKSDYCPFHMPGHKRGIEMAADPYAMDITEIDGFDNLHDAQGILMEAQNRAAALYQADASYYLVNGSTCGILAAISAAVKKGGRLLMARNCHKAVYHTAYLRELQVSYLYPVITTYGIQGVITPESVRAALEKEPDIQAVILTSPTYDGIVSDIVTISEIVHAHGIPLIVDEAHGAHLGFHPYFPQTAVRLGADVVIQSMHKTLPSFTQTALLHRIGNRVDGDQIARFLDIYETSSPSYVLMAGMDRCVRMLEENGTSYFTEYADLLKEFYQEASELHRLKVLQPGELTKEECYAFDPSKIVINGSGCNRNGKQLYEIFLNQYHLQMELCSGDYVLAMTSFLNCKEDFERLLHALKEIDAECQKEIVDRCTKEVGDGNDKEDNHKANREDYKNSIRADGLNASGFISRVYITNEKAFEIYEAVDCNKNEIPLAKAAGKLAGDYIYLYPPGIPLLVPGEIITEEMIENIMECIRMNLDVKGVHKQRINIVN